MRDTELDLYLVLLSLVVAIHLACSRDLATKSAGVILFLGGVQLLVAGGTWASKSSFSFGHMLVIPFMPVVAWIIRMVVRERRKNHDRDTRLGS
jgi:membrane protein implicated in regulation of membrane protease activity